MKKFWKAIIVLTLVLGGCLLFWSRHYPGNISPAQNGANSETASNVPAAPADAQSNPQVASGSPSNAIVPDPLASRAASPGSAIAVGTETNALADLPPATVLDKTRVVIHNYHAAFGENPVGTNPEITAALKGKNPKQINFVEDSGLRVNEKGELIDGYGTPFFFHQISGQEMEIRSAGQDHVMWTADDLVTK